MNEISFRRAYIAIGLLFGAIATGVIGYMAIEDYDFHDALYMTTITITTVGFREVHPLSTPGKIFTVFLIISSFGIFVYAVTSFTQYIVSGTLGDIYKNRKVRTKIQKLENHVIVCGFGRNGRQAAIELLEHKEKVIVIERADEAMELILDNTDLLYIHGDATNDETLESCRIAKAKALITTLPVDADNLFVVLTAREMNPRMTIISRASDENSDKKLKRAGATNVIMPDRIGGQRMAKLVAQPDVVEFLEYIMLQSSENVALEEIGCDKLAVCFDGKSIRELEARNESGANIIGLRTIDKAFIINPLPEVILSNKDKIFALGTKNQINRLKTIMTEGDG